MSFSEANQTVMDYPSHEVDLDEEDLDIPWSELVLKENIGTGILMHELYTKELLILPNLLGQNECSFEIFLLRKSLIENFKMFG